jgi:DNA polymerase-4
MTFDKDITTRELVEQRLAAVARETASRLAAHGAQGRTITLKVRFADFSTVTRASSRTAATADPDQIYQAVRRLLAKLPLADGVRLLGVTVSALSNTFQDPLPGLAPPAPTPIPPLPMAPPGTLVYREGSDVVHAVFGPGWAQSEQGPWTKVQFTTPPYARRGPLLVPTSSLTRPVSAELTTDPNPAR